MNTEAFRQAVAACTAAGGGTVRVPPGDWLTGPIHLESNVRLHLEKDAVLRFSTRPADYLPVVFTRWEGHECYNYSPLIYARDCVNVAVTGEGTLDGRGKAWWPWKKLQNARAVYDAEFNGIAVEDRVFGTEEAALRPSFFQPLGCRNVLVEGVTFRDGPMWTIHPVYCENVIVRNVSVITEVDGPNTDGLNPDSCRNVLIEDCFFSTGDDCIAINSGLNEDGRRVGRPCENVLIRRCRMEHGHGGVVIGSGMSGGVRNVHAHDCDFRGTDRGIRLKSMRGRGGVVENVWFDNVTMADITHEAIQINMFYGSTSADPQTDAAPTFRDIHLTNVSCDGAAAAVELIGLPERPLENVTLKQIRVRAHKPMICQDVAGLAIEDVAIATAPAT